MTHKFTCLFGIPIERELHRRWKGTFLEGCPVTFTNDADAWTVGEAWSGQVRRFTRVIGLTLGTGLGSGYVVDGKPVHIASGVPPDGELWNVAFKSGICEDVASGRAVTELFLTTADGVIGDSSPRAIAALASAGDVSAQQCFSQLGSNIAQMLISTSSAFQAEAIVIGGNVARASKWFLPSLKRELRLGLSIPPVVRITRRYETSTLLGAASMALLRDDQIR